MKHINGEGGSWNVLCLVAEKGKEIFIALGLKSEGESSTEIEKRFLEEFNAKPIGIEGMTSEAAKKVLQSYPVPMLAQLEKIENLRLSL